MGHKAENEKYAFCLRHNLRYEGKSYWTAAHVGWLKSLMPEDLYEEILKKYLLTFENLTDKIERLDKRIAELAAKEEYSENVKKLSYFLAVQVQTALSSIVEVRDFKRFSSAEKFASYLGFVPEEDSSGDDQTMLGITKAGNTHVRRLLVEAAQSYGRGQIDHKAKALKARQQGNPPEVISYADQANERLRRKYYKMILSQGKKANVAKTAVSRELTCFM